MKRIFTEDIWKEYVGDIEKNFRPKTYSHFDPPFIFPRDKGKLYFLLSDPSFERIRSHGFTPMLKINKKTLRYKKKKNTELSGERKYKLDTKVRPILFASHFDTYIYGFYAFALNGEYQNYIRKHGFQEVVLAYRNDLGGKCNIQFAKEAFDKVKEKYTEEGECSVVALDIKGYFDHINHDILKKMWCKVIGEGKLPPDQYTVFKSLTEYSYVNFFILLKHFNINLRKLERDQKRKYKNLKKTPKGYKSLFDLVPDNINGKSFKDKMNYLRSKKLIVKNRTKNVSQGPCGIPQGSSMSALLSNIYLLDFDKKVFEKSKMDGFLYRRYCDDLLIICEPKQVNDLKNYLMTLINDQYKLTIQDEKTEVIDYKPNKNGDIRSYRRRYSEFAKTFEPLPNDPENTKSLQYLGFEYNGKDAYIRHSSLARYFRKMKRRVRRSALMAYGRNSKIKTIYKKQIYSRYSHFGKRNFLSYARNASKKSYESSKGTKAGMDSPSIRKQTSKHMKVLKNEIEKRSKKQA